MIKRRPLDINIETLRKQLIRIKRMVDERNIEIDIGLYFRTYNKTELLGSAFYKEMTQFYREVEIRDSFFSWFGSISEVDLPKGAKIFYCDNNEKRNNCVVPNATFKISAGRRLIL